MKTAPALHAVARKNNTLFRQPKRIGHIYTAQKRSCVIFVQSFLVPAYLRESWADS